MKFDSDKVFWAGGVLAEAANDNNAEFAIITKVVVFNELTTSKISTSCTDAVYTPGESVSKFNVADRTSGAKSETDRNTSEGF